MVGVRSTRQNPKARWPTLRRKNGAKNPGTSIGLALVTKVGGCGGEMRPEYYADQYRIYQTYCRDYSGNKLFKIASGASDYDYNWTKVLMERVGHRMHGISLHYYTVKGWRGSKGSATNFNEDEYMFIINKSLGIEPVLIKHMGIMDEYDPQKRIGLMVDEWGTWFDVEPGTNPGFLFQQNSMRDAFVAGMTLNIFHKYTDRIKMANIAQIVNVLQAMILTKDDKMVLTPTYHVFDMYRVHQDATFISSELESENYSFGDKSVPALNVSVSKSDNGQLNVSIVNVHPSKNIALECEIKGMNPKAISGRILTAPALNSHNTFDNPNVVKTEKFNGAKIKGNNLSVDVPAKSVIVLTLN
jgi:alpha-N-arabinofuranosidase